MNLKDVPRQALIWVGALVAWCVIVLLPLSLQVQHSQEAAAASQLDWQKLNDLLPRYHPIPKTAAPKGSPVEMVNTLSARAGIDTKSITKLEEVNGAARVSFSEVPGDALIRFLVAVQDRGLVLEQWDMNITQPGMWTGNGLVKNP